MAAMSDPTSARQPTEAELRAYLEQLRDADPAGLVAEAYNLLAAGAQVKLGRPDARMLIDGMAALVQSTGNRLPPELANQMAQGVSQLQLAQVEAEREAGAQGADEGTPDAQQPAGGPASPTAEEQAAQRMTDRLWVPGRDPGPPRR